jgi:hypothetical protein
MRQDATSRGRRCFSGSDHFTPANIAALTSGWPSGMTISDEGVRREGSASQQAVALFIRQRRQGIRLVKSRRIGRSDGRL